MSKATITKKQSGSPAPHQSRATKAARPKRVPVDGDRDILTVEGRDPDFVYRWVKDKSHSGARVHKFLQAAYAFVDATQEDSLGIGESNIHSHEDTGSLYRKHAGEGEYLFLMRIRREYYDEDQTLKQDNIRQHELQMTRERDEKIDDGQYGNIKIS